MLIHHGPHNRAILILCDNYLNAPAITECAHHTYTSLMGRICRIRFLENRNDIVLRNASLPHSPKRMRFIAWPGPLTGHVSLSYGADT